MNDTATNSDPTAAPVVQGGVMQDMDLKFAMPLKFRADLENSSAWEERNSFASWRARLAGKTWYLLGWCKNAYCVTPDLGSYEFEYISGTPDQLFSPA